jgi:hypothetical protein
MPFSFSLQPTRLVMRPDACFYCGVEPENDERTLEYHFGIRYCREHKTWAKRDSNAYLHETGYVKLRDALAHPELSLFLTLLKSPTTIQRSNGAWEAGWTLATPKEDLDSFPTLQKEDGVWHIPMENADKAIVQKVRLSILFDSRTEHLASSSLDEVCRLLDAGVYAADFAAVLALPPPHAIEETPGIQHVLHDGVLVRAFVPPT